MTPLRITVLTLFPSLFSVLNQSLIGKALEKGLWHLDLIDLRNYGVGVHQSVDDAPYGGGAGMVMKADVLDRALLDVTLHEGEVSRFIYLSPRGKPLCQAMLADYSAAFDHLIMLCGRYEGVDQRLLDHWAFEEVSLGDFVLCGGEIPALALIEGTVRLLKGVLHSGHSLEEESFSGPLLEYPHYTRPAVWKGQEVPSVLLSGHHRDIAKWRLQQSEQLTQKRRPDLWKSYLDCDIKGK